MLWRNICYYNWKWLPSGLLWSFNLRWKSTCKSAWSPCYHGDHSTQWKFWKMPIIILHVILKTLVVKHVCITDLVSLEVELCPNVQPYVLYHSLLMKQKVCYTDISCLWIVAYKYFIEYFRLVSYSYLCWEKKISQITQPNLLNAVTYTKFSIFLKFLFYYYFVN